MTDTGINIPDREWFKTAEVCELAGLQPYVLRSWEKEFPTLGVSPSAGAARAYRRTDVELVLRIKQLVFGEGLTLAGVRRRLDGVLPDAEPAPVVPRTPAEAKKALADVKSELKAILAILDGTRWPPGPVRRAKADGQPTLLDLSPDQHHNGERTVDAAEPAAPRRAARKPRRAAPPPAS